MTWILKYIYTVSIYYSRTVDLERVPDKVTFISTTNRFSIFGLVRFIGVGDAQKMV